MTEDNWFALKMLGWVMLVSFGAVLFGFAIKYLCKQLHKRMPDKTSWQRVLRDILTTQEAGFLAVIAAFGGFLGLLAAELLKEMLGFSNRAIPVHSLELFGGLGALWSSTNYVLSLERKEKRREDLNAPPEPQEASHHQF